VKRRRKKQHLLKIIFEIFLDIVFIATSLTILLIHEGQLAYLAMICLSRCLDDNNNNKTIFLIIPESKLG
jgi:hypothetical protein